ncbi:Probable phosphoinositide 3-phosphatase [Taphrina deformans PYCC 5710]|uniref:Probable phosphoinositide 3-phosphatase n=1 Tax=Taphrina deformans (strain PYCC 5710 / ATCC 11124 / CBS 356.35 / IMI 108563 / JCM 9778 / NBRC 8474) TaxID=1097556 RepID=R4XBG5_TAPDE|nr:Probable phosphoinositide 3-phosphatase [Taphrina deformans PYCC 5710]|eukprot:CCG83204.1 Probable phosphoinositide 3-phosphatase [Taphrina deformans PYCC 5710]
MIRKGVAYTGTLHVMDHHMIFDDPSSKLELWLCYPMIQQVERRPHSVGGFSALRIRCRDFTFLTFNFQQENDCIYIFDTARSLCCVPSIDKLYAFTYKPGKFESQLNSWKHYNPEAEFARQGLGTKFPQWRLTNLNHDYNFSPTYPAVLAIPTSISDNVLNYGGKYRSKARVPVLSYIHSLNGCTITRASQPMVGLKQNRSVQDEKLVLSIFASNAQQPGIYGATGSGHLIVDARPTANAMANVALGAGSENMDHYHTAKKVYLGIENIHVMRDSLNKVTEALKDSDLTPLPPNKEMLQKSNWLKHISNVLDGSSIVSRTIHLGGSHVLVHCSDGWDRTSQLCSLAELCLDPYYRTLDGFIDLVEKDWLSFGHRFAERSGHLASEKSFINNSNSSTDRETQASAGPAIDSPQQLPNRAQYAFQNLSKKFGEVKFNVGNQQSHLKYTAPIFHQFLDCVYQILIQFPTYFEFNERFLGRLLYHTYSCQYGTFLFNNERERVDAKVRERTRCVWDFFLGRRDKFCNSAYIRDSDTTTTDSSGSRDRRDLWIQPDTTKVKFWAAAFNRTDEEMNTIPIRDAAGAGSQAPILGVEEGQEVARHSPGNHESITNERDHWTTSGGQCR